MSTYHSIAVVVVVMIVGFVFHCKRSKAINQRGIETDAVVSRLGENERIDADGNRDVSYDYFVKYKNEAGETVEAKLGSPARILMEGSRLHIMYLQEKPKYPPVV